MAQGRKVQVLDDQVMQLEKQLAVAQDNIRDLAAAHHKAEDTIDALRDENTFLKQEKAHIEGQFKQLQRSL